MALTPGTRLGPYEVTAQIGAGGMGEVYRATDTNLKRQVAIKVLPESLAADPERLARFQREAEVLAALNHPNIAHIHGLERGDATTALVMELVEGPTLADRIAHGAIPLDEALPIATQIAEALEAAHDQGIVHRDLKPANVKVRDDGTVKVLDFGLAKALDTERTSAAGSASMSPTITTPAHTMQGVILGTAAYMSPEQVRGKAVDRRTDVWAFGCVLYEMLTGKRAFEGEDISDTLGNVLKVDPDWNAVPNAVPARIHQVLRLCLQKDRKARAGDMQSVRLALDGAFETTAPAEARSAATPRRGLLIGAFAGLVVGAAVAGTAVWLAGARVSAPASVERLSVMVPANRPVAIGGAPSRALALSPDGSELVYTDRNMDLPARTPVWVNRDGAVEIVNLPSGTYGYPRVSPDGRRLALASLDGDVYTWDIAREVRANVTASEVEDAYVAWTPDGQRLVFRSGPPGQRALYWQAADGTGEAERLTEPGEGEQVPYAVSPDGKWVVYRTSGRGFDVRMASLMGDHATQDLVSTEFSESNADLSPNGRWVAYVSDRRGGAGRSTSRHSPTPRRGSRRFRPVAASGRCGRAMAGRSSMSTARTGWCRWPSRRTRPRSSPGAPRRSSM